jgi:hypothetical protein
MSVLHLVAAVKNLVSESAKWNVIGLLMWQTKWSTGSQSAMKFLFFVSVMLQWDLLLLWLPAQPQIKFSSLFIRENWKLVLNFTKGASVLKVGSVLKVTLVFISSLVLTVALLAVHVFRNRKLIWQCKFRGQIGVREILKRHSLN